MKSCVMLYNKEAKVLHMYLCLLTLSVFLTSILLYCRAFLSIWGLLLTLAILLHWDLVVCCVPLFNLSHCLSSLPSQPLQMTALFHFKIKPFSFHKWQIIWYLSFSTWHILPNTMPFIPMLQLTHFIHFYGWIILLCE